MAKRSNGYGFKGVYNHENKVIGEYDKKTETTTYYSLEDALATFDGKTISLNFKEEDAVPSVEFEEE